MRRSSSNSKSTVPIATDVRVTVLVEQNDNDDGILPLFEQKEPSVGRRRIVSSTTLVRELAAESLRSRAQLPRKRKKTTTALSTRLQVV